MTQEHGKAGEGHPNGQEDTPPEGGPTPKGGPTPPLAETFKPITTEEEFEKILGARLYRERQK